MWNERIVQSQKVKIPSQSAKTVSNESSHSLTVAFGAFNSSVQVCLNILQVCIWRRLCVYEQQFVNKLNRKRKPHSIDVQH